MSQQQGGALNLQYTFSQFPINATNYATVETCRIVATHPGVVYNPLFLYGRPGTGKTHLLQAIGNQIRAQNPTLKIVYLSCKQLMMPRTTVAAGHGLEE